MKNHINATRSRSPHLPSIFVRPGKNYVYYKYNRGLLANSQVMKTDETAASWDRVKVSLGASFRPQTSAEAANLRPLKSWNLMKSHEILRNTYKSMKMHEIHEISWNPWKSMKIDEKAASWNRVKVSLGASSRWQRPQQAAKPPTPWNPWNLM